MQCYFVLVSVTLTVVLGNPATRGMGNLPQISRRLNEALEGATCEEKGAAFDSFIVEDHATLKQKYNMPKPKYGRHISQMLGYMMARTADYDCKQKTELLDAILQANFHKVRQLVRRGKPVSAMRQLALSLKHVTKDMDCAEKNLIFDNVLAGEFEKLNQKYGIPEPDFGSNENQLDEMAQGIADKVAKLDCEERADVFDALLYGQPHKALGKEHLDTPKPKRKGKPTRAELEEVFNEVKESISTMDCHQKNEIFDNFLDGKMKSAFFSLGVDPPFAVYDGLPENMSKMAVSVKTLTKHMPCNERGALLDRALDGNVNDVIARLGIQPID